MVKSYGVERAGGYVVGGPGHYTVSTGTVSILDSQSQSLDKNFIPCYAPGGTELFQHQGGPKLISEGWYDIEKNVTVTLPLYALNECLIYKGAYVDAGSSKQVLNEKFIPKGDFTSCMKLNPHNIGFKKGEKLDPNHLLLYTTRSSELTNRITCTISYNPDPFYTPKISATNLILDSNDENAMFMLGGVEYCNTKQSSLTITDIGEARARVGSSSKNKSSSSIGIIVIIGVICCVVLLLICVFVWCWKKKSTIRLSVDSKSLNSESIEKENTEVFKKGGDLKLNVVNSTGDERKRFEEYKTLEDKVSKDITPKKSIAISREEKNTKHNRYTDIGMNTYMYKIYMA